MLLPRVSPRIYRLIIDRHLFFLSPFFVAKPISFFFLPYFIFCFKEPPQTRVSRRLTRALLVCIIFGPWSICALCYYCSAFTSLHDSILIMDVHGSDIMIGLSAKTDRHSFLVADTQLYERLCPSVRWSVRLSVHGDRVGKCGNTHFRPCPPVRNWYWPCIRPCLSSM